MRTPLFLVFCFLHWVLWAQEGLITYRVEEKDLITVLSDLEEQFDLHFAYAVEEIRGKRVSVSVENIALPAFLNQLLRPQGLSFEIVEGSFIVVKKSRSTDFEIVVQDAMTEEKLAFATAKIKGADYGFVADDSGILRIRLENSSDKVLILSFLGYHQKEINIDSITSVTPAVIFLERDVKELEEVIIKEYLTQGFTIDDETSHLSIDVQDMYILPGLSERDVLLSVQMLPGIGSADESASGLNIRGSSRDQTQFYWNNIPIYQPAHYFGNISSFIPSSIGSVEIYKNHIPLKYGGASSGLLVMKTRKGTEKPVIESNINMTHGDIYADFPLLKNFGNIAIGVRRSFNDWVQTPTFNALSDKLFEGSLTEELQGISSSFEYNSRLIFGDLNLMVNLLPTSADEVSLSFLRSTSDLDYNSEDEEVSQQNVQAHEVHNLGGNITWTRHWIDLFSTTYSVSISDYEMDYEFENFIIDDEPISAYSQARNNDLRNLESRLTLNYQPKKSHSLELGYQWNYLDAQLAIDEEMFSIDDFSIFRSGQGITHGLFADYFGKLDFGLHIGGGVRFNRYEEIGENRIDGQLRINYELLPGLLLKSTLGSYHQYLSSLKEVQFIFSNVIEQSWVTAGLGEGYPIIKNDQVVLGGLFTKKGWVFDIDAYRKRILSPVALLTGNLPNLTAEDQRSSVEVIKGVDLTIKRRWKYFRTWLSYAFQDSNVEAGVNQFPSSLNVRHQFQLSQTINYRQFEISMGYTIRSGLPYTSVLSPDEFLMNHDDDLTIEFETINGSRLPIYHRWDFSTWFKFKTNGESSFRGQVGISVLNLLNTKNILSRSFLISLDPEEQPFLVRQDRLLLGRTPNISLRFTF